MNVTFPIAGLLCLLCLLSGCAHSPLASLFTHGQKNNNPCLRLTDKPGLSVTKSIFGELDNEQKIEIVSLRNTNDTCVSIITLGAAIVSLNTADKFGNMDDIVLGFDNPRDYLNKPGYFGSVIGRYANRIADGKLELDGKRYSLSINNKDNHLHGGRIGFDKRVWTATVFSQSATTGAHFDLLSPDGDQGYPGNLKVRVSYYLDNDDRLTVRYYATTDKPTVVNLSQHTYFNLEGHQSGDALNHHLQINADHYTPIKAGSLPTGEILSVESTPMDFREGKAIAKDISHDDVQLRLGRGFDHNWVLNKTPALYDRLHLAAKLEAPLSGRTLTVYTDQPGMQFYSGNFIREGLLGKQGAKYAPRHGLCLETQHFPDSPNQTIFPSTRLDPESYYNSATVFQFGVKKL